jgi:hypothetical protein
MDLANRRKPERRPGLNHLLPNLRLTGTNISFSSNCAIVDFLDFMKQLRNLCFIKHLIRSCRRNIREGRLVEQSWVHHPLIRHMLNNHIDEFNLSGGRRSGGKEFSKCFLHCNAIEPDERANKMAETPAPFSMC